MSSKEKAGKKYFGSIYQYEKQNKKIFIRIQKHGILLYKNCHLKFQILKQ